MPHLRSALAAVLCLSLSACGDPREDFSGRFGSTAEWTEFYSNATVVSTWGLDLEIVADHFDSERLFLDFDCGLNAKMEGDSMVLIGRTCPAVRDDQCIYSTRYDRGHASVNGDTLTLSASGFIDQQCPGNSGNLSFSLELSGRRGAPAPTQPGQTSRDGEEGTTEFARPPLPIMLGKLLKDPAAR
ncbi:hypothetical protein ACLESO_53520 [Pyxidicoccus sp. 3LG]